MVGDEGRDQRGRQAPRERANAGSQGIVRHRESPSDPPCSAEPAEQQYFNENVKPHLGGDREYVGEVTHGEKVELLQHARATVFPISWQEPFGLVMIESMACGTPVIATRWGAVSEVIDHVRTGIIVNDWRQTAGVLGAADALDPASMRRDVEERFTPERMVADYVAEYEAAASG